MADAYNPHHPSHECQRRAKTWSRLQVVNARAVRTHSNSTVRAPHNVNRPPEGTFRYRLGQLAALRRQLARPESADRVSRTRQLREMFYLRVRGGLGPLSYYRLGLYRSALPWREKKNFVSEEWYGRRMEGLNLSPHRIVAWSKLVSHSLLKSFDVPMPPFLGVANSVSGQSCDGRPLRNADDLADLIRAKALDGACFKLIAGNSGRGFLKVSFHRAAGHTEAFIQPAGPRMNLHAFWRDDIDHGDALAQRDPRASLGYLCEGIVDQHPAVAALHADSVNTARVWMFQPRPGQWEIFGALLRMGVGQ